GTRVMYTGDVVPLTSDRDGGPYYLQTRAHEAVDAARTNAGEGRWINDPRGSGRRANSRFVLYRGRACVELTRDVQADEEIFVSYGGTYWRYQGNAAAPLRPRGVGGRITS